MILLWLRKLEPTRHATTCHFGCDAFSNILHHLGPSLQAHQGRMSISNQFTPKSDQDSMSIVLAIGHVAGCATGGFWVRHILDGLSA